MPCFLLLVILLFPRVALVLMWIFSTYLQRAFHGGLVLPVLGFIFLPLTTLVYAWELNSGMPTAGINLLWYRSRIRFPGYQFHRSAHLRLRLRLEEQEAGARARPVQRRCGAAHATTDAIAGTSLATLIFHRATFLACRISRPASACTLRCSSRASHRGGLPPARQPHWRSSPGGVCPTAGSDRGARPQRRHRPRRPNQPPAPCSPDSRCRCPG